MLHQRGEACSPTQGEAMSEPETYDERRDNPQPCRCGRLVTSPDLCERETGGSSCLMEKHPHAGPRPVVTPDLTII